MSTVRYIYDHCSFLQRVWRNYLTYKKKRQLHKDPRPIINAEYKSVFGCDINWEDPKDLIEKIDWLQVYTDTSMWTLCADKYRVRDYVQMRGCSEILNQLYGMWEKPEEISWNSLPDSFVIKTNNSCGQILLVKDKKHLDVGQAEKQIKEWMKTPYGFYNAQMHYMRIKPCIIAEKLLNDGTLNSSLIDYKIWCFDGKPECILVAYDRGMNQYSLSMFDSQWSNISERALNKNSPHYSGKDFPKPISFDKMLNYAKLLSEGFPEVRVDFYEIKGHPVFGELTFTTGFGSYNKDFYRYLGDMVDLGKVVKLPHINTI